MKMWQSVGIWMALAGVAFGQGGNVPDRAKDEILRRGDMAQPMGLDNEPSVEDAIADALAVPEDDSHKWFFTLVTMDGCKACDMLKSHIRTQAPFKAWINVDEPLKSPLHYQVRRSEDPTQRDWIKNIGDKLRSGGFPAVVIQPPRNGEYGKNETVVAILHGYDGDPDAYIRRCRKAIETYVRKLHATGALHHVGENSDRSGGHAQASEVEGPPPFVVPPTPIDPFKPDQDWPAVKRPLTRVQIKAIFPGAPEQFVEAQIALGVSSPDELAKNYDIYLRLNPPTPNEPANISPQDAVSFIDIISLLLTGSFGAAGLKLWQWWRMRVQAQGEKASELEQVILRLADMIEEVLERLKAKDVQPEPPPASGGV